MHIVVLGTGIVGVCSAAWLQRDGHRITFVSPVPAGEAYVPVEGPRGEQGFTVVPDGSNRPWRIKSRAPSLLACQALEHMIVGGLIADVIAVIGSIDVVMGDVDR